MIKIGSSYRGKENSCIKNIMLNTVELIGIVKVHCYCTIIHLKLSYYGKYHIMFSNIVHLLHG